MPFFMPDDELSRLSSDAVAEKADEYIRKLYGELDSVRAKADALESQNSKLQSDFDDRLAELSQSQAQKHQLHLQSASAELVASQAMCIHLSQARELMESHTKWLDEELTAKVESYAELRRRHSDLEAEISAKLLDVEKNYNECSSSLTWHKERLRELESKIKALSSCKAAAATSEEQYNAELFTANKLVELYKESSEEWSRKAGELEGVIKALEKKDLKQKCEADDEAILQLVLSELEEVSKAWVNALKAVSAAESRAAEARLSDLENAKALGVVSLSDNEMSVELRTAEIEKWRGEVESSKNHMLQYKSIAQVNETALKLMESAHENFRLEAEKGQEELISLRERVLELENDAAGKEKESLVINSQMSTLKNDLETEHEKWRVAQRNYERQVILLSETIQELTKTSQAFAALQEEASELRKLAGENAELHAKWSEDKVMLEQQKNKYHELNEQNKILHSRLEAMHAKKVSRSGMISSGGTDSDQRGDSGLQSVVSYLRKSKEIAETEISLLRQDKLRLQSQLESAVKMAESARGSLNAERASTRASLLTEDDLNSLKLQINEMNLLRVSNMQLREENKLNFEKCQRLLDVAHKARTESENSENVLQKKQIELDMRMKEMERLRAETDLQEKRLRETVADYNRLKDEVRQLEEKLKAQDARTEDLNKLLLEKQNKISVLEKEITSCKKDLSERESKLEEGQQAQATMQSEIVKLKADISEIVKLKAEIEKLNNRLKILSKKLQEAKEKTEGESFDDMVHYLSQESSKVDEEMVKLEEYQKALAQLCEGVSAFFQFRAKEKESGLQKQKQKLCRTIVGGGHGQRGYSGGRQQSSYRVSVSVSANPIPSLSLEIGRKLKHPIKNKKNTANKKTIYTQIYIVRLLPHKAEPMPFGTPLA